MSFHKETADIDLGDTPIENIFINDFMPMANGTYVKVYLLGYKYATDKDDNIEVNNETLAKHLNIPLSDVLKAWDFWEEKGIIKKRSKDDDQYNYVVEFLSLKQLYIDKVVKPGKTTSKSSYDNPYTCSPEELVEANKNPAINNMFNEIRTIMRRYITPNEYKKIYEWMHNYNMSTDMILKAFQYSAQNKNKRSLAFIHGIIKNWYDSGITNLESLLEYYETNDERYYRYERIIKALGFRSRFLSEGEVKVVNRWFDEWKFTMDVVLKACENTKNISNPNINYIDSILSSWHNKGIKNVEDINEKDKPLKKAVPSEKVNRVKTKFHNFEQTYSKYSEDEIDAIVRRISEEKMKK